MKIVIIRGDVYDNSYWRDSFVYDIYFNGFYYKKSPYHIYIETFLGDNYEIDCFLVTFGFNNAKRTDYPDEILSILKELKFKGSEEDNSYKWESSSEESAAHRVKQLTKKLFELKQ